MFYTFLLILYNNKVFDVFLKSPNMRAVTFVQGVPE